MSLHDLLSVIPQNTYDLVNSFFSKIESARFDVITRHRMITVLPIATLPEAKYPSNILPKQSEFIQHILSRPVITSKEATTTFIQFSTFLAKFIYSHIQLFAKAVCFQLDKPNSHFIIYSVVPSFFGFFTSHDQASLAAEFYSDVMKTVPPEFSIEVMKPFFSSALVHRFIESAFTPLLEKLGGEIPYFKNKSKNKEEKEKKKKKVSKNSSLLSFAQILRCYIINSCPLLPIEICSIFEETIHLSWSENEFSNLFIDAFLLPNAIRFVSASPFLWTTSSVVNIINFLKPKSNNNTKIENSNLFISAETILSRTSKNFYVAPPLYKDLGLPYVDLALTVADILVAFNSLKNVAELPPSLKGSSSFQFRKSMVYKMFAVRVFFQKEQNEIYDSEPDENVVFNIHEISYEENPDFEKAFNLQHMSDIPLDLVDAIGADSCNIIASDDYFLQMIKQNNNDENDSHDAKNKDNITLERIDSKSNESIDKFITSDNVQDNDLDSNSNLTVHFDNPALKEYAIKKRANIAIRMAHSFENFLRLKLSGKNFMEFTKLVHDLEIICTAPIAMNIASYARGIFKDKEDDLNHAYNVAITYFNSSYLHILIFLFVRSRLLKKIIGSTKIFPSSVPSYPLHTISTSLGNSSKSQNEKKTDFLTTNQIQIAIPLTTSLTQSFEKCNVISLNIIERLRKTHDPLTIAVLKQGSRKTFWRAVNYLMALGNSPASIKFIIIDKALSLLKSIQKNFDALLSVAFVTSGCESLPSLISIFELLILNHDVFLDNLGPERYDNWKRAINFFHSFTELSDNFPLKQSLDNLRKKIYEELKKIT